MQYKNGIPIITDTTIDNTVIGGTTPVALSATQETVPTIYGSSAVNGDLTLEGTSSGTKTTSYVILQPTDGNVAIGTTVAAVKFDVLGLANTDIFNIRTSDGVKYRVGVNSDNTGYMTLYDADGNPDIQFDAQNGGLSWINNGGNFGMGTTSGFGTSAGNVLSFGNGTSPTTSPANVVQIWSTDFLGTDTDARLHIMGEGSAVGKTVLGSGKITSTGTTGGYTRQFSEATANITANQTITITLGIPSGTKILGCQLRVDSALAAGETWNAAYSGGNTQTIGHEEAVAANTKINVPFDGLDTGGTLAAQAAWAAPITTATTNIAIQKHSNPGVDVFSAQGTIRAIVYYEAFDTMASL